MWSRIFRGREGASKTAPSVSTAFREERSRRVLASFISGAVGDALGWPVEFDSTAKIKALNPDGISFPDNGHITDDTQMTLFGLEALVRSKGQNDGEIIRTVDQGYRDWLDTQREERPLKGAVGLLANDSLYARRAPGMTCLGSLSETKTVLGEAVSNDSKGSGTIMRVAPFGLLFEKERAVDLAGKQSLLTHGHPTATCCSEFWAAVLNDVLNGKEAVDAVIDAYQMVAASPGSDETLNKAMIGMRGGKMTPETVDKVIGTAMTAENVLATAINACLFSHTPEEAWVRSVFHGGDSDTSGAVAGNLIGLMWPEEVLDHPWSSEVELSDEFIRLMREWGFA